MDRRELSDLIISMDEIIGKLNSFFTDSVILKMNYSIEALGNEVESLTGFSSEEMTGHPFSRLCADHGIQSTIAREIRRGYFEGVVTSFLNRENEPINVSISGFYLGLISEINGYIILKVKILEDNSFLKKELVTKKRELDSFIYRTAHDLRGPIATIKGLVNLLKMRTGEDEVDKLTGLIELHADKLDDRLFKLLYVADNGEHENCIGKLKFDALKEILTGTLKDNFQVDNTVFNFSSPDQNTLSYINEFRLARLLNNLLLYIVGLPIATIPTQGDIVISLAFEIHTNKLRAKLTAKGFLVSETIRNTITQPVSLYNDILNYPFLFNYYVAQRECTQLKGIMSVDFVQEDEQLFQISIPLNLSMTGEAESNPANGKPDSLTINQDKSDTRY